MIIKNRLIVLVKRMLSMLLLLFCGGCGCDGVVLEVFGVVVEFGMGVVGLILLGMNNCVSSIVISS